MKTGFAAHAHVREDHTVVLRLGDDEEGIAIINLSPGAARQLRNEITESLYEDRKWNRVGFLLVILGALTIAASLGVSLDATTVAGYYILTANQISVVILTEIVPAASMLLTGGMLLAAFPRRRQR